MRTVTAAFALAMTAVASPSLAEERDYCPARPGLGTPPCTIEPGRVSVEVGLADWQRDNEADKREDTLLIGDTLLRIGVSDKVEALVGWTPFGSVRTRDEITGRTQTVSRLGDVLIGAKANLRTPDGSGFSIAVQPFAVLPVGREPVGASDWSAGVVVPMSYDLSDTLNLQFSPQADAATDGDGRGRHLAYSGTLGLGVAVSEEFGVTFEIQAARDHDPDGRSTPVMGAVSAAWMPARDRQLDFGANLGINRAAPALEVYFGYSQLF
jgi:hypothetical protein